MSHPFDRRAIPAEAQESRWFMPDGHAVRRIDWRETSAAPRGSILFLPGRGDFYEKYLETLAHWHALGWHVTASDWRGQAGSGRLGSDGVTGHIDDFGTWIGDLASIWAEWVAATPGPHILIGHSMGGHLILRAVAEGRVNPAGMILSAPMLGFIDKGLPAAVMRTVARGMQSLGDARRPAWKWSEKPGEVPTDRIRLLTHDADRYGDELWWRGQRPDLVMGPGSWRWVERSYASFRALAAPGLLEAIRIPVLILAAQQDKLVSYAPVVRAASRLPNCELIAFGAEASHELLREEDGVRDRVLAACDAFLSRIAASEAE